ncbi:hypothetical protein EV356DRAFT_323161 [Viridothelium virens]|uniref:Cupredoxin n=1 Tax=Viridothelium virens TaxID=1048519 RepID=A0A6A6GYH9_VIRVR|nr:hypothetical protein EV356DRAFT_323161 [Viridothelium virens]
MYFTKSIAVAILAFSPSVVLGQSTGQTNGQNTVQLGAGGNLMFTPNMMTVQQGDNVTFAFMSAAHGVMSTSLSQPNVADNQVYSGIIPVDNTTPTPPGKKLPKNKLRIRGAGPIGYVQEENVEEEKRGLAALLGGGANGNNAKNGNNGNAKANNGQLTVQNSGQQGVATFSVQMNTVGMQAFVCPAAQHAANGMIMMVNVLPAAGAAPTKEKRQSSDAQLQQALTNYLAVGQKQKTVVPTAQPGTGGQLNAVAASVAQTQSKNGKPKKNSQGQVANAPVFTGDT